MIGGHIHQVYIVALGALFGVVEAMSARHPFIFYGEIFANHSAGLQVSKGGPAAGLLTVISIGILDYQVFAIGRHADLAGTWPLDHIILSQRALAACIGKNRGCILVIWHELGLDRRLCLCIGCSKHLDGKQAFHFGFQSERRGGCACAGDAVFDGRLCGDFFSVEQNLELSGARHLQLAFGIARRSELCFKHIKRKS